jgi:Mor family transcriptional regulator
MFDAVAALIEMVRREIPDISKESSSRLELAIRSEFGGDALYIAKRNPGARDERVCRDFNGRNRDEVCRRHGISRSTFYEILKRSRAQRPQDCAPSSRVPAAHSSQGCASNLQVGQAHHPRADDLIR